MDDAQIGGWIPTEQTRSDPDDAWPTIAHPANPPSENLFSATIPPAEPGEVPSFEDWLGTSPQRFRSTDVTTSTNRAEASGRPRASTWARTRAGNRRLCEAGSRPLTALPVRRTGIVRPGWGADRCAPPDFYSPAIVDRWLPA
jgi:hypothetical protein